MNGVKSRVEPTDGGFILNGSKIWCTNSSIADFILVAAKQRIDAKDTISLFIVERDAQPALQLRSLQRNR